MFRCGESLQTEIKLQPYVQVFSVVVWHAGGIIDELNSIYVTYLM